MPTLTRAAEASPQSTDADSEPGERRRALIHIEPQRDYATILERIASDPVMADAWCFIPNGTHAASFAEAARTAGRDVEERLVHYATLSPEHDEALYAFAMDAATRLHDLVLSGSGMIYGDRHRFLHPDTRWAFIAGLVDRFAGQMRPTLELQTRVSNLDPSTVYLFPGPGGEASTSLAAVRASAGGRPVRLRMGHLSAASRLRVTSPASVAKRCRQWPVYDLDAVKSAPRGNVLLMGNFKDRQYQHAVKPILPELARRHGLVLAEYIPGSPPEWIQDDDIARLKPGYLGRVSSETIFELTETDAAFVSGVVRRFRVALSRMEGFGPRFADTLALFATRILFPILLHARDTRVAVQKVLDSCASVVVVPGRALEPNVFVGCAQARGIPTFEIQSGTIAPSRRFIRPLADRVMAIDPYSRHVFTRFLGKPSHQVTVTGSPKLEADLTDARGVSRAEARARLPELTELGKAPMALLASQPLGLERSGRIAEIAIAGCAGVDGLWLGIKPHPNETDLYVNTYRRIAARLGFERLVIMPDARIHDAINASDLVATYFSTVGLESFALKRPVLCINPYDAPPPYDLVRIGIATEVKDAESACAAMAERLRDPDAALTADPELEAMRDGRASQRVARMIGAAARRHGHHNDPSQVGYHFRAIREAGYRAAHGVRRGIGLSWPGAPATPAP